MTLSLGSRRAALATALLTSLALLAGCGGGKDAGAPAVSAEEISAEALASTSVSAFLAYTRQQIAGGTSDSTEARDVGAIRAPVSDTGEPAAI